MESTPLPTKKNYNKKKNDIYLLYNNNEVKAAGILFYTIKDDKKYYLLTETNGKLSDIGGKIEKIDKTILDIAIREFSEEVNGNLYNCEDKDNDIKIKELIEYLKNNIKIENEFYIPRSKYFIFVGFLQPEIMDLHIGNEFFFGNIEIKENRDRKIFWKSIEQINEYKYNNIIHPRLWNNKLWKNIFGEKLLEIDNDMTSKEKFLFKS
jgi:hypothetical protein